MNKKRLQQLAGIQTQEKDSEQLNETMSPAGGAKTLYSLASQLKDAATFMEEGNRKQGMSIAQRVYNKLGELRGQTEEDNETC